MNSILIISGENSGEKYGARLVQQFKKLNSSFLFFGIGGKHMASQGVDIIFPVEELAVIGGVEIISRLPRIKAMFSQMEKEITARKPEASVLIDSPDFNLRMAKKLRKLSIPVLYYISPTVWAWRKGRLKTIRRTVDKMLLIFPFEEEIYRARGIPASYVGHPLKEWIKTTLTRQEFFKKFNLDPHKKLIAILPGSRRSELKYHMPVLIEAVKKIKEEFETQFVLVLAENLDEQIIQKFVPQNLDDLKILRENSYDVLAWSDLVLSACGTANLESALLETPVISFYRLSPLTYYAGVRFIRIKNYSIVNILGEEKIIPELIQRNFNPENLFQEAKKILTSEETRSKMVSDFKRIKNILGEKKASQNAAQELKKLICE